MGIFEPGTTRKKLFSGYSVLRVRPKLTLIYATFRIFQKDNIILFTVQFFLYISALQELELDARLLSNGIEDFTHHRLFINFIYSLKFGYVPIETHTKIKPRQ